ncbi:MAG: SUMF1/EgtB/PvdO family nonheme iron enzyme [Deltaproteobacteria bacterium]|nr:SUMF1/EgtB/PvdO family nonheme iron enzyme [Nannocystaceae bacterium]
MACLARSRALALGSLIPALACYSTPDSPSQGTADNDSTPSTGPSDGGTPSDASNVTAPESGATDPADSSASMTVGSSGFGSEGGTPADDSSTTLADSSSTTPPDTDDPSDDSSSTGPAGCDPLDDTCGDGLLCDGTTCIPTPAGTVAVPGGAFMMGCNEDTDDACGADELPYHEVTLSSFAIDQTEVTRGAWQDCVEADACDAAPAYDTAGNACNFFDWDYPAACMNWAQAAQFCSWRGGALPTEAQWEKAARGTDERIYPWGDAAATCDLANSSECGDPYQTVEVGSKPAGGSPYGALDMSGNVFEWVADWYSASYYEGSPDEDPSGPDDGTRRLIRSSGPNYGAARSSWRGVDFEVPTPASSHVNVGLRCAYAPG